MPIGWPRWRVLMGLGFSSETLQQPVSQLSGGQQNRLVLAKLLLEEPDLLILDEPSNHLDLEATEWLEDFLLESGQAIILVSHDRYFLDKVTDRTLELLHGTVDAYTGNFSAYQRQKAERLEDYGYGKQFGYVFETFLALLGDLDQHVRAGRNVILIAHDCTTEVPNPNGPNWLRYEPRLQSPGSGKCSIRLRVKEWCDHVLYFGYDKGDVTDGKMSKGFETRTIYPVEMPHCMAKSRTCNSVLTVGKNDPSIWSSIIK